MEQCVVCATVKAYKQKYLQKHQGTREPLSPMLMYHDSKQN